VICVKPVDESQRKISLFPSPLLPRGSAKDWKAIRLTAASIAALKLDPPVVLVIWVKPAKAS
jgi:hypothetical protein